MLIIIISRSSLKLDHVGSKTRLLGHQATQVSDLGPLWPSCLIVVRQEFSNFDSSVVVHEQELAINRTLYGFLCS